MRQFCGIFLSDHTVLYENSITVLNTGPELIHNYWWKDNFYLQWFQLNLSKILIQWLCHIFRHICGGAWGCRGDNREDKNRTWWQRIWWRMASCSCGCQKTTWQRQGLSDSLTYNNYYLPMVRLPHKFTFASVYRSKNWFSKNYVVPVVYTGQIRV